MFEIILAILLAILAAAAGWFGSRKAFSLKPAAKGAAAGAPDWAVQYGPWLVGGLLFLFEVLGVLFSLYVTKQAFSPSLNTVILSLGIAAVSYAFTNASRPDKSTVTITELFMAFKDGFLWQASLPALANIIGVSGIKPL